MIFITIGPRQIAGWSRSMRKPRLITFTPCASSGTIFSFSIGGGIAEPHHARDVRAVDVAIEEPDAESLLRERDGEVHRDGGLADTALAARDRDDAAERRIGDRRRRRRHRARLRLLAHDRERASRRGRRRRRRLRGRGGGRRVLHVHAHFHHAIDALDRLPRIAHERRRVARVEQQGEAHLAVDA